MLLKIAIVAGALALAPTAQAAEVQVKSASGAAMVFEPALVKIAPGDTVRFIPTDKSHDVASVDGMLPAGVQPFEGKVNEELAVTFTTPGIYGFKCKPHYGMGMVGVVVVGTPDNLAAAKAVKQTGMAKKAFDTLLSGL